MIRSRRPAEAGDASGRGAQHPCARPGQAVERASPGLAALFGGLEEDGRHSILDLGSASGGHLEVLARFARRIRFAGVLPDPGGDAADRSRLEALLPEAGRPYDVVLAWDALDRFDAEGRAALVGRVAEVTAEGARLYAVVDGSGAATRRPKRCALVAPDRVADAPAGPPEDAPPPLLPAHVERLLAPFVVERAYALRSGLREYLAVKPGRPGSDRSRGGPLDGVPSEP